MFKLGDKVCCQGKDTVPRWNFDEETLSWHCKKDPKIILSGEVVEINHEFCCLRVKFVIPRVMDFIWDWPLPGHTRYCDKQWERPGYLCLAEQPETTPKRCNCPIDILMGQGCICGGS